MRPPSKDKEFHRQGLELAVVGRRAGAFAGNIIRRQDRAGGRMRHKFVLVGAVALLGSTLGVAEMNRFRLQVGASMSGTDEYTIARTADGFVVAGNSRRTAGGQTIEMKLGQSLAPDRSLRRYALQTTTPSGQQTADALRDGGTVEMKVVATGSPRSRKVPFTPGAVLLDNLVTVVVVVPLNSRAGTPAARLV